MVVEVTLERAVIFSFQHLVLRALSELGPGIPSVFRMLPPDGHCWQFERSYLGQDFHTCSWS